MKKFILNKFRSRNLDKETFKEFLKEIYLDIFPECVAKGSRCWGLGLDLCSRCFAVSSSCRRRVRRRGVVNSLPLGGTFALRSNPYLQSVKSGESLARNARFGASKSQNVRSFSCFGSVSMQARRFFLAGAAL